MPVKHIVLLKFRADVPPARVDAHLRALLTLKEHVPGVLAIDLGANFTDRAFGYTHGVVVVLADKAALAAYGPHPYHQQVAQPLRADAELMVLDYEF